MTGSGLWSKIDVDTSLVAAKAPQERGSEDKKAFHVPSTWPLDLISIPIWLYIVAQLFFFDVDDYIFEDRLGLEFHPGNYRLLFVLGVLLIVVLFAPQYWFILAYVVFFPLVVLFWKIPRLIYRTRSWLFLFVVST